MSSLYIISYYCHSQWLDANQFNCLCAIYFLNVIKTYSLTVNLNGLLKAFTGKRYHMSKMNGVSNLLATWVRFTLSRKHIYTSNRNTNGLLGKAVGEG